MRDKHSSRMRCRHLKGEDLAPILPGFQFAPILLLTRLRLLGPILRHPSQGENIISVFGDMTSCRAERGLDAANLGNLVQRALAEYLCFVRTLFFIFYGLPQRNL